VNFSDKACSELCKFSHASSPGYLIFCFGGLLC
jgi:hypothetical protein